MSENLLYRIRSGDVQLLEEALCSWTANGSSTELARELEDAVNLCLDLPDDLRAVWDATWRRLTANQIDDYQKTGEMLRSLFDRAVNALTQIQQRVEEHERQGPAIRRSGELPAALERLQHMRQQFVDGWLWITPEIIQEAREEYARGEFQTVREILDELQGKNP